MHVAIWRFLPAPGREAEFLRAYAADGAWATLFARAEGFAGLELFAAADGSGEFITIDRWRTREAFAAFKAAYAQPYAELDRACEALTARETLVGYFDSAIRARS